MSATERASQTTRKYHTDAYRFVFAALQYTQEKLDRSVPVDERETDERDLSGQDAGGLEGHSGHISGGELLEGIRDYALAEFGLMARTVFETWNIHETRDFGEIVFDLVERGEMRATENDCMEDFEGVYSFEQALDSEYRIATNRFC